jgi:PAS domain S-box-containing protein
VTLFGERLRPAAPAEAGVAVSDVTAAPTEASLLATVLESSSDAILFIGHGGVITGWNDAAEKMFGATQESALTGSFEALFSPERRDEMTDLLLRASRRQSVRATTVALRSDGSRLIVETACSAVAGANGGPAEYVLLLRDVTEPTLIRAAAAAVTLVPDVSAALESLVVVLGHVVPIETLTVTAVEGSTARGVASAGPGAAKLQGGEILSTAGTALAAGVERRHPIVCHDTRTGEVPYDSVLAKAGVGSYVVLPLLQGGRIAATLNVGFALAGAPTASVVRLLSSLTASVMPIVLNLVTLEERARSIRQLEELDAHKNELLGSITHDMRTPLAVINGFAELMQDRWTELPDAEKLESVDAILRNGQQLSRLVEQGLDTVRIKPRSLRTTLPAAELRDR